MRKYIVLMAMLSLLSACSTLTDSRSSSAEQKNSAVGAQAMDHKSTFFVAQKGVKDGYVFIFHVMPAPEGKGYSRTNYHLMVSVEKNGKPLTDLKMYSAVKHPDGSSIAKAPMMLMGNWYMALYNLSHEKGQHWLTVSFERAGKTYSSGVYYPERAYHQ
jgi:hypothetical protein